MSRNLTLLKKYMKRKRKYSLKELKELLIIDSDDDLMTLIVDLLEKELERFNFNMKVDRFSFLLRSFEYLNWQKSQLNFQDEEITKHLGNRLSEIEEHIEEMLSTPGVVETEKLYELNADILKRMIKKIKEYLISNKLITQSTAERYLYQIMHEIIFDDKVKHFDRYSQIESMLNKMPLLKNVSNTKGQFLIEVLSLSYLDLITKKGGNFEEDILYIEQVLKLFSKSYYDDLIILKIKSKIEQSILEIKCSSLIEEEKRRLIFHIEQLLIALKINKEKGVDLNYKYKIQTAIEDEDYQTDMLNFKGYKDLRKKRIFTIDNPRAKRKDDALSFEKNTDGSYELGIYITDVDAYVKLGSLLDQKAKHKAALVSDRKIDLFPKKMAVDNLSLNQYSKSPVVAFTFNFDAYGNLLNFKIEQAIVEIERNYSYSDSDRLIHKNRFNLQEMQQLLIIQNEKGLKNIKISDLKYDNYSGKSIVNQSAVFLNSFMASYCASKKVPFIYRNDTVEISDVINKLLNDEKTSCEEMKLISEALKDIKVPYNLSTKPIGYRCSPNGVYGSLTSPIYRLDSLANLRIIKRFFIDQKDMSVNEYEVWQRYADEIANLLQSRETKTEFYKKDKMLQKHFK
jgi:hypothetical protein